MISQHPFNPFSLSFPSETPITHILVPSVVFHLSLKLCSYWMLGHAFKPQAGNFQFCLFNYLCRTSESARGKSLSASKIFPRYAYHSYIQRVLKILSRHPFFEFFFPVIWLASFLPQLVVLSPDLFFLLASILFLQGGFWGWEVAARVSLPPCWKKSDAPSYVKCDKKTLFGESIVQ